MPMAAPFRLCKAQNGGGQDKRVNSLPRIGVLITCSIPASRRISLANAQREQAPLLTKWYIP